MIAMPRPGDDRPVWWDKFVELQDTIAEYNERNRKVVVETMRGAASDQFLAAVKERQQITRSMPGLDEERSPQFTEFSVQLARRIRPLMRGPQPGEHYPHICKHVAGTAQVVWFHLNTDHVLCTPCIGRYQHRLAANTDDRCDFCDLVPDDGGYRELTLAIGPFIALGHTCESCWTAKNKPAEVPPDIAPLFAPPA